MKLDFGLCRAEEHHGVTARLGGDRFGEGIDIFH